MITVSVKHFSGFEDPPQNAPTVLAGCLITPTSMTLDEKTGTLYITELATGRVVSVPIVEYLNVYISQQDGAARDPHRAFLSSQDAVLETSVLTIRVCVRPLTPGPPNVCPTRENTVSEQKKLRSRPFNLDRPCA